MNVYALMRVDWHDVDGEFNQLVDIYQRQEDADAARVNHEQIFGKSHVDYGTYFIVHEKELK